MGPSVGLGASAGCIPEVSLIVGLLFIPESPRWLVCTHLCFIVFRILSAYLQSSDYYNTYIIEIRVLTCEDSKVEKFLCVQAKAGKKEELSLCLQKLRGKDFNTTQEIADIQVRFSNRRYPLFLIV